MSGGSRPLLAIDSGSPRVSVAVGDGDTVLAETAADGRRSSGALLAMIDRVLGEAGLRPADLGGLVALRGPGSFTGLRVGLATTLGMHQALGLPATALPTLEVLAAVGPEDGGEVVAVVDAMRGEWFAQRFRPGRPPRALGEPRLVAGAELAAREPAAGSALVVGFGAATLAAEGGGIETLEPPPLAPVAVRRAACGPLIWEPATLVEPLYLRPPSARPSAAARGGP